MKNNNSGKSKSLIFTRETFGMALLLFCLIVLLALCSGSTIFAGFGSAICTFMYGVFGYGCFFVVALFACLGVWLVFEKRIKIKVRPAMFLSLTVFMLFLLFHAVSTRDFDLSGSNYITDCYDIAANGFPSYTFGGVISAAVVYPVAALTTFIGAYIIFALLAVLCAYFTVKSFMKHYGKVAAKAEQQPGAHAAGVVQVKAEATATRPSPATDYAQPQPEAAVAVKGYDSGAQYPQQAYEQPVQQYPQAYDGAYQDYQQGYSAPQQYEQPYDDYQQGYEQPQGYVDPYAEYLRNQEAYNNAISGRSSSASDDKYAPEKLGRQIIFDRDEFAAESYRRNGIFDENSYFNHPVRSESSYLSAFSDGKSKPKGTTVEPTYNSGTQSRNFTPSGSVQPTSVPSAPVKQENAGTTYTSAYQQSVEEQPTPSVPGIIYGATPVQKLEDDPAYTFDDDVSSDSYSGGNDEYSTDFDAPETDIDQRGELAGNAALSDIDDVLDGGNARSLSAEEPDRSDRLDSMLFGGERGTNDFLFPRRSDEDSNISSDNERTQLRGGVSDGLDFTRRSRGENADVSPRSVGFAPGSDGTDDMSDIAVPRRNDETDRKIVGFGEPTESTDHGEAPFSGNNRGRDGSGDLFRSRESSSSDSVRSGGLSSLFSSSNSRLGESRIEPDRSRLSQPRQSNANLFDDNNTNDLAGENVARDVGNLPGAPRVSASPAISPAAAGENSSSQPAAEENKPPHIWKKYVRPPMDLLDEYPEYTAADSSEIEQSKRIIVETLESFRVGCEISDVVVGPAITRFDIIIQDRTNIKNSLRYRESIAMALKKENVNAYLNYSKGALSIEVPNAKRSVVGLKTMMRSTAYTNAKVNSLTFALGKNVEGACICPDITKMPHLLVAGTTGSGKSICLSSLLISLLYKYGPEELRFILVDPKQVEFISYDKLPHLMINEIIYDVDKAIKALNWAIKEMERRYSLFKDMTETGTNAKGGVKVATKDINEYNSHLEQGQEKLPKIVIVLDEFGDLMLQAKKDIESRIIKLVQKARAAGIHLILATQRPSVDCITGLIKSNLPTRIGFKVGSFDDSRTIFDIGGAEKLLGKGDMYFRSAERPELMRIQGCFVDTPEVQRVTDFIKQHNETYFDQSVSDFINKVEEPEQASGLSESSESSEETKIDDTFIKALKYCVMSNAASVSMIQRRFPIGYIKACKIIDWMENMNYITKSEGSKSRKVLLSQEEFFNTYGDVDD